MSQFQRLGSLVVLGVAAFAIQNVVMEADTKPPPSQSPSVEEAQDKQKSPGKKATKRKEDPEKKDLYHFMRKKLDASGKVLEGLAVEDFDLIKEGAEQLNTLSTGEKFRVSNDPLYRNFSNEFQRLTKDLMQAADDENLDRAALKWMDATLSCIECHRFTRGILIAGNIP